MSARSIPSLDFSKAKTHRKELASELTRALEGVGFLYIDNVQGFDPDELLRITKWFFSLSLEQRLALAPKQWNPASKNTYRGYFPIVPGNVENKEALEVGGVLPADDPFLKAGYTVYENSQWPQEDERCPNFKEIFLRYYTLFDNLSAEVLRLLALGMGFDEHSFDYMLQKPLSTFRLLHYPPRDENVPPLAREGDVVIQCAAHCDNVFTTFLATFENKGLEIEDPNGQWMPVEPRPQSLVMNIGRLLSKMSRDRFKATKHRVVYCSKGEDRYSVPFFFEPYGRTDCNLYLDEYAEMYSKGVEPISKEPSFYANWIVNNMKIYVEYKNRDFGPEMV